MEFKICECSNIVAEVAENKYFLIFRKTHPILFSCIDIQITLSEHFQISENFNSH